MNRQLSLGGGRFEILFSVPHRPSRARARRVVRLSSEHLGLIDDALLGTSGTRRRRGVFETGSNAKIGDVDVELNGKAPAAVATFLAFALGDPASADAPTYASAILDERAADAPLSMADAGTLAYHEEQRQLVYGLGGESAAAGRQRALEKSLRGRREELERIDRQDGGLAASEAELSARLWEVQETRRRHEASRTQLVAAISELEDELRRETDATGATDAKNGNGTV